MGNGHETFGCKVDFLIRGVRDDDLQRLEAREKQRFPAYCELWRMESQPTFGGGKPGKCKQKWRTGPVNCIRICSISMTRHADFRISQAATNESLISLNGAIIEQILAICLRKFWEL